MEGRKSYLPPPPHLFSGNSRRETASSFSPTNRRGRVNCIVMNPTTAIDRIVITTPELWGEEIMEIWGDKFKK